MLRDRSFSWSLFFRSVLLAVASLLVLGATLYMAFWLPFRGPDDALPRHVEILPLEESPAASATEPPPSSTFDWVDRQANIVRIPIDQAIRLVAEELPVRPEAARAARERQQVVIPTDAGSGRFVIRRDQAAESTNTDSLTGKQRDSKESE